ncbi:MAG: glycosyltransferase [Phycisphaerae bacterium]
MSHLLDSHCGWEQHRGTHLIQSRGSVDQWRHNVVAFSPKIRRELPTSLEDTRALRGWSGSPLYNAIHLARYVTRERPDICHAWSVDAAHAASVGNAPRILLTISNPADVTQHAKRLRTLEQAGRLSIACSSETVLRRLVENGLDQSKMVLIRPGVDFAEINRTRKSDLRATLGIDREDKLIVLGDGDRRSDAIDESFWALKLMGYLDGGFYGVIPRPGRERNRMFRWESKLIGYSTLIQPEPPVSFEALVSVADYLVLSSRKEISTTCIAWAMAAETLVIAPATYGIAEIIGSGLNGLLYKQPKQSTQATEIFRCLQKEGQAKLREVARGHAFEVFAAQRSVDQYLQLYKNLFEGRPPGEGVVDTAQAS